MVYKTATLPNGLRVATEAISGVESVAFNFSVDVGARYETEAECGLSHILEHMAFKGTKTRNAQQIAEQFDAIGGHFNAYTSLEHTVYHAKVLSEYTPIAIDILKDILQNSVFDAAELKREQEVIVQEIGAYADSPEDLVVELFDQTAFPNQPVGRSILGTAKQVMSYQRDDIISYQNKHYQPNRIVFSAAGKLSHEEIVLMLEDFIPQPKQPLQKKAEKAIYAGGELFHKKQLEQSHIMLGVEALDSRNENIYSLNLLASVLGGGMSSRLFQEIREKRGLVYHVSAHASAYSDTGIFSMYAATDHKKVKETISIMRDEFEKLADDLNEAELARAKAQMKSELVMSRENPASVAGWIGRHLLVHGEYRNIETLLAKIANVQASDVKALAKNLLTKKQTLSVLGG